MELRVAAAHAGASLFLTKPVEPYAFGAAIDQMLVLAQTERMRVLVVDDDRDTLELLDAVLGQAGAAVRLCTSSAEALQAYAAERPDVVISDLEMPGEDGLTFMQKLRAREAGGGRQLPSIALTGYGRTEDRMRALGAGYNLHMPKPVVPAELLMVVASLAGR